jgi:hypothetical protein
MGTNFSSTLPVWLLIPAALFSVIARTDSCGVPDQNRSNSLFCWSSVLCRLSFQGPTLEPPSVTDSELILIGESLRDASVAISDVIDATPRIEQPA